MNKKTLFLFAILMTIAAVSNAESDHDYGGYVSNEETRFKGYVWDFLEEIGNDCTTLTNICTDLQDSWINEIYTRSQYYWGSCKMLIGSANSYVDSVDLAYVAGHGNASTIWMSDGEQCNLQNASWGDKDLESIVFHSCQVLKMDSGWRARWKKSSSSDTRPFNGLHHAMGFTTNHNNGIDAGAWASDEFAENLEDGYSMRWSWYEAVEDAYWLSPYAVIVEGSNKQAVFYIEPNKNEDMQTLQYGGSDYTYGDSSYLLNSYYRE